MQHFLQLDQPPSALFSTNAMMVAGVLHAMNEHGLKAPADIAIVGFDDLPQTAMIFPALTTISQPTVEIGICAGDYVHMVDRHILDSLNVTRGIFHAATSTTNMTMTTDALIFST